MENILYNSLTFGFVLRVFYVAMKSHQKKVAVFLQESLSLDPVRELINL